jgi:hypothetical protein
LFSDHYSGEAESGASSFDPEAAALRIMPSTDSDLGAVTEPGENDDSHTQNDDFDTGTQGTGTAIPSIQILGDDENIREPTVPPTSGRRPRAETILRRKRSPLIEETEDGDDSESSFEDWELPSSSSSSSTS